MSSSVLADVMNLNDFMPTHLEDATPLEVFSFDSQTTTGFIKNSDADEVIFRQNFRYGLSEVVQLETFGDLYSGGDERDSGQITTGGLVRLNEESSSVPSFALSPMFILPTGKYAEAVTYDSKFIMTKTVKGSPGTPEVQIHLNLEWAHNPAAAVFERMNHYMAVLGFSYKYADQQAFVFDIFREEESIKGKEINLAEFGIHQELGSNYFIALGIGLGMGDESQDWQSLFSFEKQFQ